MKRLVKHLKIRPIHLVLVVAIIFRFYQLSLRFGWSMDQSLAVWPIIKLWETKKLTLIGVHFMNPKSALFRPPFFTYMLALPWKMFNFSPISLEAMFGAIGVLVVGVIYKATKGFWGEKVALLAAGFYAINPAIILIDKTVHTITPVIITGALIFLCLRWYFRTYSRWAIWGIGWLIGLGMSFHFQLFVLFLAIFVWGIFYLSPMKRRLIHLGLLIFGFSLPLLPLLVFNLRHDWIMVEGFKRTFFSPEVIQAGQTGLVGRGINATNSFADLVLKLIPVDSWGKTLRQLPLLLVVGGVIFPGLLSQGLTRRKLEVNLMRFYWLVVAVGWVSLGFVNQGYYGDSAFYLWFFLPLLLAIWAKVFWWAGSKKKLRLLSGVVIGGVMIGYIYAWLQVPPGSFLRKMALIDYIFDHKQTENFGVRFIGTDVLTYDYLFHYANQQRGMAYSNFRLLEQWQEESADFFIIEKDYDFDGDVYGVKPFRNMINFNGTRLVVR